MFTGEITVKNLRKNNRKINFNDNEVTRYEDTHIASYNEICIFICTREGELSGTRDFLSPSGNILYTHGTGYHHL